MFASDSVAVKLRDCDFIFLAADSMRGRLVVNALTHQYLIPSVQMGSERLDRGGHVHSPAAEAGKGMPLVQWADRWNATGDRGKDG